MNTPEDDLDALAGEYVLGLLGPEEVARVEALRRRDGAFDAAVNAWQMRLLPLTEEVSPVSPPARVWAGIAAEITPRVAKSASLWNNLNFWRALGFGAGGFGALGLAAALVALVWLRSPPPMPIATATLASQHDGVYVATAQQAGAGVLLVVSPSQVSVPADKSAELWLVLPTGKTQALGLLASDRPITVTLTPGQLGPGIAKLALAVSIEPPGGSPTGVATGPIISVAKFLPL
ncbi:MAG: anti-sigma factor [Acidocella sp.]|nr:anti-sigma factor [Acidocella sp.]